MKITRIHVEGFRSLRDVTFEPGPVTVLIGANGSGKSNLLGFLGFVPVLWRRSLGRYVAKAGGASQVIYRGPTETGQLTFDVEWRIDDTSLDYQARLERAEGDKFFFGREVITRRYASGATVHTPLSHEDSESDWPVADQAPIHKVPRRFTRDIEKLQVFHFHDTSIDSPLRKNARAVEFRQLAADGKNLASYLLCIKQSVLPTHQAAWTLFNGLIRRVAPFIKELVPTPVNADPDTFRFDDPDGQIDNVTIRLDWIDDQDTRFGVSQLSDGTLRAIALFAALTQPTLPSFICIDEPELGLHPAALNILAGLIRSASTRCQVLVATQSPALLDYFAPEEVVVAERIDGATQLRRLDPVELESWLEDYSLSELYDKNVLGGRP